MLIDFRELFPKYNIHPKGVLHVGGNKGEEAPVYLELGIKRQVWIEADPEIFLLLKSNLSNNPEAVAFNFAAGDEDKDGVILHVANNGGQSSSILELGTHKIAHPEVHYVKDVKVNMYRLDTMLYPHLCKDLDFLNLDVQGFEGNVLRGMGSLLDQFKWVYTEINCREVYTNCALLPDMDLFMTANRFRRVETFGEFTFLQRLGWSDCLYVR